LGLGVGFGGNLYEYLDEDLGGVFPVDLGDDFGSVFDSEDLGVESASGYLGAESVSGVVLEYEFFGL